MQQETEDSSEVGLLTSNKSGQAFKEKESGVMGRNNVNRGFRCASKCVQEDWGNPVFA